MHWLLAGYIWLFIHRPFEVWPWLGDLRFERIYMLVMIAVWLASGPQSLPPNRLNWAMLFFSAVMLVSFAFSPFHDVAYPTVEDYLKTVVFYVLLLTSVRDGVKLRFILAAFLVSMALYMGHSLLEYFNGRYHYRMSTQRMMGVDRTYSDPNAFAGTICYALPAAIFWFIQSRSLRDRGLLIGYFGLSGVCILLTGSRAGLVGLLFIGLLSLRMSRRRIAILLVLLTVSPIAWGFLPEDRKNRFITIIDPSYGPQVAQSSAESRILGFWDGIRLWQERPILGVGPGAHSVVSYHGRPLHNLYGQLLADLGSAGVIVFLFLLNGFMRNHLEMRSLKRELSLESTNSEFAWRVSQSVVMSITVLLVLGMAGHNLYRYQWVWMAAFQVLAMHVMRNDLFKESGFVPAIGKRSLTGYV